MGRNIDETYEEIQIYKKYGAEGFMCKNKEKEVLYRSPEMCTKTKFCGGPGDWVYDKGLMDVSHIWGLSDYKILWDVHGSILYLDRGDHKERIDLKKIPELEYKPGWSKLNGVWMDFSYILPWIEENIKEV